MNDFLYTFSSKQFSSELDPQSDKKPKQVNHWSGGKKEGQMKSIRTKKLKRYDRYMQPKGEKKHLT